mmetsp:Transcript_9528/g.14283  ORF Transcript_9528/g.14283 Transcript_9528/m.14283 type:complete len:632 (-) Transcript_9528:110-2005(-)
MKKWFLQTIFIRILSVVLFASTTSTSILRPCEGRPTSIERDAVTDSTDARPSANETDTDTTDTTNTDTDNPNKECRNDWTYRISRPGTNSKEVWCKWLDDRGVLHRNRLCNSWNNERLVKEACPDSCGLCGDNNDNDNDNVFHDDVDGIIPPPSMSPIHEPEVDIPPPPPRVMTKQGLILGLHEREASVDHFKDSASWFYNYGQRASKWQGEWADAHGIEYVPMITKGYLTRPESWRDISCYFNSTWPTCTQQDVIDTIRTSIGERAIAPKFLIGFNEMYNNPPPIDLTPEVAAFYWGKYVQPAAIANKLILVSPTTAHSQKGMAWYTTFLKRCYDNRNDPQYPCDVEVIQRLAVHEYECTSSVWDTSYGTWSSSNIITNLSNSMGTYGGKDKNYWSSYFQNRALWVTEMNCYWESEAPHLDSREQCLRITGQKWQTYGSGPLVKINSMENIERYAWWDTWHPEIKPNYLTYLGGQLTPIGRGYMSPGDPSVNCDIPGVKYYAKDASLTGPAELFTCFGTGTEMIRYAGLYQNKVEGTISFSVDVPSSGNYAINVSYLTRTTRKLTVAVNSRTPKYFSFRQTGKWCFEDGAVSTAVPIELKGLTKGTNLITFGDQMKEKEGPIIEWISIVL